MYINKDNQSASSIERSSHKDPHPVNNERIKFLIILGLLLLFLAGGGAGYHLGTLSEPSMQSTNTSANTITPIQTPTLTLSPIPTVQPTATPPLILTQIPVDLSPTRIITKNAGMVAYEHPTAHYTLEYPALWNGETDAMDSWKDYENFTIKSPDYYFNLVLKKGMAFWITVQNTTIKSIEDLDKGRSTPVRQKIIESTRKTIVDGVQAIQYDDSYEGVNTNTTQFIKNGKMYRISYVYVDDAGKKSGWNTYLNLLKSFKAK